MNTEISRFANPSAIMALGLTLFSLSSNQIEGARINVGPGGGGGGGTQQKPCPCEEPDCNESYNMSIEVGLIQVVKTTDFQTISQAGIKEGQGAKGSYRNFEEARTKLFNPSNPLNTSMQVLKVSRPDLTDEILTPRVLDYHPTPDSEYIEHEGALKQVKTLTHFTDIEVLDDGYIVKVWPITKLVNTDKTNNLYKAPTTPPTKSVQFKNPDYPGAFNKRLIVTRIDNPSGSATPYIVSKYYDYSVTDKMTMHVYGTEIELENNTIQILGGGVATPLEREVLEYISRGARPWDYTFVRTVENATLTDGNIGNLNLTYKSEETFEDFSTSTGGGDVNGKRMVKRVAGFGATDAQTTSNSYYNTPEDPYMHGRLESVQGPDGSWEYYEYTGSESNPVSVETKYESWKDIALTNYTSGKKTVTTTQASESLEEVSIAGVVVSKTKQLINEDPDSKRITTIKQEWDGVEWNEEKTIYDAINPTSITNARPLYTLYADGTAKTFSYAYENGQTTLTEQVGEISNDISGGADPVIGKGTQTVKIYNDTFNMVSEEMSDIESGLLLSSSEATEFDVSGRPTKVIYNSNPDDYIVKQYGCCGLEYSRDRSGATTTYYRDALKRVYRTVSQRSSTGDAITTNTDFDGLTTKVTRSSTAGTLLVSETTRSLGGLTTTTKSPDADGDGLPEVSTREIVHNAGTGSTTTNTAPDNSITITATFLDGNTKAVSGSAVTNNGGSITYDYGTHALNGGGLYTQVTQANGTQSTKAFRDQLGRSFRTENADGTYSETSYYAQSDAAGSRGKVKSVKDADETALAGSGSLVTYGYNARGERVSTTTKLSNNQQMVTTTEHDDVDDADIGISHRYRTWVNGVLTNTSLRSGDGYKSKTIGINGSNVTLAERSVPVDGAWTATSTAANGAFSIQTYEDGLMKKSATYAAGATDLNTEHLTLNTQTHDAFGRTLTATDARTGTVTYGTYLENGAVTGMTDAGARTTVYTYDNMGRTTSVDAPDTTDKDGNTIDNITHTSYNLTGTVAGTWGDQTYTRFNVYDDQNRLVELRTFQDLAHGTEPTLATTGFASTKWNYNPQRGWLDNKRYDDNKGTDYTYTNAGRLKTRTWSRGITTTYGYDQGQMVSTDYSDATQGVAYAYDNFGRPTVVTQGTGAAANQHAYVYDPATLVLKTESISYASGLVRNLDRSHDNLLRPSGFQLMNGTTEEHATSYGYDTAGRLAGVHTGATYPTTPDFTYGYLDNSGSLLETVTGPAHTVTNTYEATRNVLDVKTNASSAATVSAFDYTVNALGQRDDVNRSGSAFASANTETWKYNAKGEVVTANSSNDAFDRSYEFDGIGNRKKSADSITLPAADNYSANTLNQLTTVNGGARIHDADGNLTDDGEKLFVWDAENRLIEIKLKSDNSTVATYGYEVVSFLRPA